MTLSIVSTTVAKLSDAKDLARLILKERLGACVQISEVLSLYEWEGKVCEEQEQLMRIKTTTESAEALKTFIAANHPYKVPEIIVEPIHAVVDSYARWVEDFVR